MVVARGEEGEWKGEGGGRDKACTRGGPRRRQARGECPASGVCLQEGKLKGGRATHTERERGEVERRLDTSAAFPPHFQALHAGVCARCQGVSLPTAAPLRWPCRAAPSSDDAKPRPLLCAPTRLATPLNSSCPDLPATPKPFTPHPRSTHPPSPSHLDLAIKAYPDGKMSKHLGAMKARPPPSPPRRRLPVPSERRSLGASIVNVQCCAGAPFGAMRTLPAAAPPPRRPATPPPLDPSGPTTTRRRRWGPRCGCSWQTSPYP